MKKVCVIGGSGFLGSHVADELTLAGYDVSIFDARISGWKNSRQKMIVGSILDQDALDGALKDCFAVYNFAAVANLNDAIHLPLKTVEINILGNAKVLESCKKHPN